MTTQRLMAPLSPAAIPCPGATLAAEDTPRPRAAPEARAVDALRDLYEEHWEFVWRALRAHGVREADLEDQTHEVFLVVHRKLPEFEGRSRVTTWLWSIAERVASDWRRRAHVRREELTDAPPDPPGHAPRPDENVEQSQARAALEGILDTLVPEQRVVFVLFELDAMPAEEIAALVHCPVNTVYSRLRLARKQFERSLARARARGGW